MVRTLTTSCYMFQRDVSMCHLFQNSFLVSKNENIYSLIRLLTIWPLPQTQNSNSAKNEQPNAETKPNKCQMDITNIMFRNFRSTVKLHHLNCALPWPSNLILQAKSRIPEKSEPVALSRRPFKRIGIHLMSKNGFE